MQRVSPERDNEMNSLMAGKPPRDDEYRYEEPQRDRIIWSQISLATKMAVGARDPVVDDKTGYLHFRVTKTHGDFRMIIDTDPKRLLKHYTVMQHINL